MEKKDAVAIVASTAGEEAPVPVQAPVGWNLYEPGDYVPPKNPYDSNIVDEELEITRVCSPSLVLLPFPSSFVRSSVLRVQILSSQSSCVRSCVSMNPSIHSILFYL
jgi:hypothetical protein